MPAPDAAPLLWRLARLEHDRVRNRPVLLYPEGVVFLNDTGAEILALCDGHRTVAAIAAELGRRYGTNVSADVAEFLDDLAARELVDVG